MHDAEHSLFASFAQVIRKDASEALGAVTAPWSRDHTEGQVNKLKLVRWQIARFADRPVETGKQSIERTGGNPRLPGNPTECWSPGPHRRDRDRRTAPNLSIPAKLGFSSAVGALAVTDYGAPWWLGALLGVAVATMIGFFNGLCITRLRIVADPDPDDYDHPAGGSPVDGSRASPTISRRHSAPYLSCRL